MPAMSKQVRCRQLQMLHKREAPVTHQQVQAWLLLLLASTARAGPFAKAAFAGCVFLASITALPVQLWRPQLKRLAFVCGTLALFTLLGAGELSAGTGHSHPRMGI